MTVHTSILVPVTHSHLQQIIITRNAKQMVKVNRNGKEKCNNQPVR